MYDIERYYQLVIKIPLSNQNGKSRSMFSGGQERGMIHIGSNENETDKIY